MNEGMIINELNKWLGLLAESNFALHGNFLSRTVTKSARKPFRYVLPSVLLDVDTLGFGFKTTSRLCNETLGYWQSPSNNCRISLSGNKFSYTTKTTTNNYQFPVTMQVREIQLDLDDGIVNLNMLYSDTTSESSPNALVCSSYTFDDINIDKDLDVFIVLEGDSTSDTVIEFLPLTKLRRCWELIQSHQIAPRDAAPPNPVLIQTKFRPT